jgi:WD40 repeat protein
MYTLDHYITFKAHFIKQSYSSENFLYQVNDIRFLPGEKFGLVSGGSDGRLKFWDLKKKIMKMDFNTNSKR